jgi:hypothetical protein
MNSFSWHLATFQELYAVMFDDGANIIYRIEASAEVARRKTKCYPAKQYKQKQLYGS